MVTRIPRTLTFALIAALLSVVAVSPQAYASEVTTWEQLRDALAAGGEVTVGADITGGGVVVATSRSTTLDLAGHDVTLTGEPAIELVSPARLNVTDSVGDGLLTAEGADGDDRLAAVIGTRGNRPFAEPDDMNIAGELIIRDAAVRAYFLEQASSRPGAVIGGGRGHHGGIVTVLGGELYADASGSPFGSGAAIGGGDNGNGGSVVVYDGTVEATGSDSGAAIGGGAFGHAGHFTLHQGSVTAHGGAVGAGIGGGSRGNGGETVVAGGRLIATGSFSPAIGSGYGGQAGPKLYFSGGYLSAESNIAAPIGADKLSQVEKWGTIYSDGPLTSDSVATTRDGSASVVEGPLDKPVRFTSGWTGDVHRTVIEGIHDVTFTFNNGQTDPLTTKVAHGGTAAAPPTPTRNGYDFAGWYLDVSLYDFDTAVTAPVTLSGRWVATKPVYPEPAPAPAPAPAPKPEPEPKQVAPVNLVDVSSNKNSKHYTHFHREIEWLASTGITKGWNIGGGKYEYRPYDNISREAMAAFLFRFNHL